MAERPIFVPVPLDMGLVKEVALRITWNPGFAVVQKRRNIVALHEAAAVAGYAPILETSTKSEQKLGRHLSAFHLKVRTAECGDIPLECGFQGSKVFEAGGPFRDLYAADPRAAKRDERLRASGRLTGFSFEGESFGLEPKTAFYDWLYLRAIFEWRDWLARLFRYAGFSDIEFNPQRSVNCQARSCALFVTLMRSGLLERALRSADAFVALLTKHSYPPDAAQRRIGEPGLD